MINIDIENAVRFGSRYTRQYLPALLCGTPIFRLVTLSHPQIEDYIQNVFVSIKPLYINTLTLLQNFTSTFFNWTKSEIYFGKWNLISLVFSDYSGVSYQLFVQYLTKKIKLKGLDLIGSTLEKFQHFFGKILWVFVDVKKGFC